MNELRQAFPGQSEDEPVFIYLRRYYIAFLPYAFFALLMLFISIAIFTSAYITFRNTGDVDTGSFTLYNWLILCGGFIGLFAIVFTTVAWLDFYFDINVVTDRRVVDINQNGLFSREISELSLEDVEDVSVHYQGLLPNLFNYGDVMIQTAGTVDNFNFYDAYDARNVAAIIIDLSEQAKRGIEQSERFPETAVKGVINNCNLNSRQELVNEGALLPTEKINHAG